MDLEDSGIASDPLGLFCARLKRLQTQSGIKQTDLLGAAGRKRSQVSDILNGKIERPPDWRVTIAIVRACLEHAKASSRLVPPDLSDEADWQRRYFDLEQDFDSGARAEPSREEHAGGLLAEVTDPFALEVHHPVQTDGPQHGLSALPPYVAREHDEQLGQVVAAAVRGKSGVVVLVGGSSTGKTRACWEALDLLRDQGEPWRLWHPIDPARPEAALRELPSVGPRTVVWLNEAQFYLDAANGLGEQIAAGLREALRDPSRAPVLVLATLWPQYWDVLTARPPAGNDPHAQARELLAGRDITVPAAFTAASLRQLADAADPRLAQAARTAEGGQVIQFLAGAPELLARYRNAPPAAAALIVAAMDARRLGVGVALPMAFLEAAAPGYLTDTDWDRFGEDWLEQALTYTAAPCNGIQGPLSRIRPRTIDSGIPAPAPTYRLADYLDQHGRKDRSEQIPPAEFWAAAAAHAAPADQSALGRAADGRGLYRDAVQLHKNAAASGIIHSAIYLAQPPECLASDPRPVGWAATHASLIDPLHVGRLLDRLRHSDKHEQVTAVLARAPGASVDVSDPRGVAWLLHSLRSTGSNEQATVLAARATPSVLLSGAGNVAFLLDSLKEGGEHDQVAALLARDLGANVALSGDPRGVAWLLDSLRKAGEHQQASVLAARAVASVSLKDLDSVHRLLRNLLKAGEHEQAAVLAARVTTGDTTLKDLSRLCWQWDNLCEAGEHEQGAALVARAAATVALDDREGVLWLLRKLPQADMPKVVNRLPAAGMFRLYLKQQGSQAKFRFGRDPDGSPAAPWRWDDLELRLTKVT
jgi:transcriptional regulator with XRE-family HTH domain